MTTLTLHDNVSTSR